MISSRSKIAPTQRLTTEAPLTLRAHQDRRDRPGAIPHPKRGPIDSTGPYTRAIRLTRWAASAARRQSEYLARGAEHVSSM
jgi:hypothetical protein